MGQPATKPTPAVDVSCCVVCGTDRRTMVCSAQEIEAQHRYLAQFHERRLRRLAESAREDRIDFTQDYATAIVSCAGCGLIYRNPRPPERSVLATYTAERYAPEHLLTTFQASLDLFRDKVRVLRQWLPQRKGIRILEVGSFVCSFLAAGRQEGWDVLGVDPGEQASAFCASKGLPVHLGTLADLNLPSQSVDCVAIWNTFDQLPDPHQTLRIVQSVLRPGGLLAIRVPNGACFAGAMTLQRRLPPWASGWLRAALAWNNLLTFPYLFGYSVPTLDRLLSRYELQRLTAQPDTLMALADANLKWWATAEEQLVKLACRTVARSKSLLPGDSCSTAPWLDLYYRKISPAA